MKQIELIDIKDLEIGDEVLISCQSHFKYLKILAKPRKSGYTGSYGDHYKTVRCSTKRKKVLQNYGGLYSREEYQWELTPENHNKTVYVDLNNRHIILVKKEI